jgi:hypothetical protein
MNNDQLRARPRTGPTASDLIAQADAARAALTPPNPAPDVPPTVDNVPTWATIAATLTAPFPVEDIEFKPGKGGSGPLVYLTARAVAARLDEAVGPGGWTFTWEPIIIGVLPQVDPNPKVKEMLGDHLRCVRGSLIIHGVAKQDVGNASDIDPDKGAISDALKRCAVLWGIGRYLYGLPVSNEREYKDWYARATGDAPPQAAPPPRSAQVAPTPMRPRPAAAAPPTDPASDLDAVAGPRPAPSVARARLVERFQGACQRRNVNERDAATALTKRLNKKWADVTDGELQEECLRLERGAA